MRNSESERWRCRSQVGFESGLLLVHAYVVVLSSSAASTAAIAGLFLASS